MKKIKYSYGWKRDLPDMRDYAYSTPHDVSKSLPPKVDLRPQCPPVVDQKSLGSCTANAIASAHYFHQFKQSAKKPFQPSRLFIYYNERLMEGTIQYDAGASIRDGFKSIANEGVCPELLWKYDITKFTIKPPQKAYTEATQHQALQYQSVHQNLAETRGCLAEGYPFVFGFRVYESFESEQVAKTGIVPFPSNSEATKGGHAVMAVGYDDSKQYFIVQNSWGLTWGDKGFFYMPYSYLLGSHMASDFWTLRNIEI